jgi:hypothetical protein
MTVLREYQDSSNSRRPHRAADQAAPLRPPPEGTTDPDHFLARRRDRASGIIHEYRLVAQVSGTHQVNGRSDLSWVGSAVLAEWWLTPAVML